MFDTAMQNVRPNKVEIHFHKKLNTCTVFGFAP